MLTKTTKRGNLFLLTFGLLLLLYLTVACKSLDEPSVQLPKITLTKATRQSKPSVRLPEVARWSIKPHVLPWQCQPSIEWSPDSTTLAYTSKGSVWITSESNFTSPIEVRRGIQPKWSPKGRLAVLADSEDGWFLQIFDESTAATEPIELADDKTMSMLQWLDEERVAIVWHRGISVEALYEIDTKQGTFAPLVAVEDGKLSTTILGGRYYWSPDQSFLLIERPSPFRQISLLDVATQQDTPLTGEESTYQKFESWSPDGVQFLYEKWTGVDDPLRSAAPTLYLWNLATRQNRELVPNAWGADWSTQGEVAFQLLGSPIQNEQQQIVGTDFRINQPFKLFLVVADTASLKPERIIEIGQVTDIDRFLDNSTGCDTPRPDWSPNGRVLLYWNADGLPMLLNSEGYFRLDDRPFESRHVQEFAWSPNSKYLAMRTPNEIVVYCLDDSC